MKPKDRFLKLPQAKTFADMALADPLQTALDYAILELEESISREHDPQKAWGAHAQITGALRLRQIIETIAFPDAEPKSAKTPTLNYDAYNKSDRSN